MKNLKPTITYLAAILLITACQTSDKNQAANSEEEADRIEEVKVTNPCDSPRTVADLLACAGTIGKIDSSSVSLGSDFNGTACLKAWNDMDTVLTVTYADSIDVWRVGEWPETSGNLSGHWFTNYSAKANGLTRAETINMFALSKCSNFDWSTCVCNGTILPADTIIQYEDKVRVGSGEQLRFGIVGKNQFGSGGAIQWNLISKNDPPFKLLSQEKW